MINAFLFSLLWVILNSVTPLSSDISVSWDTFNPSNQNEMPPCPVLIPNPQVICIPVRVWQYDGRPVAEWIRAWLPIHSPDSFLQWMHSDRNFDNSNNFSVVNLVNQRWKMKRIEAFCNGDDDHWRPPGHSRRDFQLERLHRFRINCTQFLLLLLVRY